jgi:hypothetical protein
VAHDPHGLIINSFDGKNHVSLQLPGKLIHFAKLFFQKRNEDAFATAVSITFRAEPLLKFPFRIFRNQIDYLTQRYFSPLLLFAL